VEVAGACHDKFPFCGNLTPAGYDLGRMRGVVSLDSRVASIDEAVDDRSVVLDGVKDSRGASVVSVGYGSGDRALGGLGIVGPTRMDYPGNMAAVRAVARYVGHLLAES
jgi:hypothetical protein